MAVSCCTPTIQPFNEAVTTINYSTTLRRSFGNEPNVQVYYAQDGNYVLSDDMNQVKFDGTNIEVDHGGPQVGFIKIF